MGEWPERLASMLGQEPMTDDEVAVLLDVARDVAHHTERRWTPVSTFLLGLAVAGADDRAAAVREHAARIRDDLGVGSD